MRSLSRAGRVALVTALAALASLVASDVAHAAAIAQIPVITGSSNQMAVAAEGNIIAWSHNSATNSGSYNLYVRIGSGAIRLVNPAGTQAWPGGFSGGRLIFRQTENGQDYLRFYNVVKHTFGVVPDGWNTNSSEYSPTISGQYVLFGRMNRVTGQRKILLGDLTTKRLRVLAYPGSSGQPGQVNGNWATWTACTDRGCNVYEYGITTGRTVELAVPGGAQYNSSVAADGTVYFFSADSLCGYTVTLNKRVRGEPIAEVASLTGGGGRSYVDDSTGSPVVYYPRYPTAQGGCAGNHDQADIYKVLPHNDDWTQQTPPWLAPGWYTIAGITAPAKDDAWLVGIQNTDTSEYAMGAHWNGRIWTPAGPAAPAGAIASDLFAVSSSSPSNVWAGGDYATRGTIANPSVLMPLVVHYDGTTWTNVALPAALDGDRIAQVAVGGSNDTWVLAEPGSCDAGKSILLEHWDGSAWTQEQATPCVPTTYPDPEIRKLYSTAPGTVWEVGELRYTAPPADDERPWATCLGATCPSQDPTCEPTVQGRLFGLAGSGSDIWLVGYTGLNVLSRSPLACHWDGTSWSDVSPPAPGSLSEEFQSAVELPNGQVWAVGVSETATSGDNLVMRYTPGAGWESMPFQSPYAGSGQIVNEAGTPHTMWTLVNQETLWYYP